MGAADPSLPLPGFPTIKTFPGGSAPPRPYEGAREGKAIVEYATKNMPTFVKRATNAKEAEALKEKARICSDKSRADMC